MRHDTKRLRSFLGLCLALILLGSTCLGEGLPTPQAREDVPRNKYDMILALDPQEKTLAGTVNVTLTNTSDDAWAELCFRDYIAAIGNTLDAMRGGTSGLSSAFSAIENAGDGTPLPFTRTGEDGSVVQIVLPAPLQPGETMEVRFAYTAPLPENAFRYRWATVAQGESLLLELANFYPVLAIYEQGAWQLDPFFYEGECFYSTCADYSLALTLPEGYTVAATGTEERTTTENGLCTWRITAENVRDMGITACNGWEYLQAQAGEVQVRCYYFANDGAKQQGELMLETALAALEFFSHRIGGYPYATLDVVMTNDLIGAIEFPAYVRVGDYSADMLQDASGYIRELVMENTAHEVAHQWFYAVVGNNSYQAPWLDESFASFCQWFFQSQRETAQETAEKAALGKSFLQGTVLLDQSYGALGKDYIITVYERGKYFLYDLMQCMGEDAFFAALQEYYATYAFGEASTQDFVALVRKHGHGDAVNALLEANLRQGAALEAEE